MAPVAEVVPQTGVVVEGGNITLICNSSGVPSPSVVWTQVGTTNVLSQNNLLRVVNVSRPETPDNMIQYQCTASNGVGTPGTAAVNITVQCELIIVHILTSRNNFSCEAVVCCMFSCKFYQCIFTIRKGSVLE